LQAERLSIGLARSLDRLKVGSADAETIEEGSDFLVELVAVSEIAATMGVVGANVTKRGRPKQAGSQAVAMRSTLANAASNRRATSFAIATGVAANPITSPFIRGAPG
jgi:hypothetical protein